jgi:demethylmenaquinone methyltransferase/2-methoxy-6-polyprenyl-1,4-benzoquinol methylase
VTDNRQPTTDNARDARTDPNRIRSMFASIARRYDRANTVLSAGVHHRWRRTAVRRSGVKKGDRVLDCATGTGDLAIAFHHAGAKVVGIDFTAEMIELARAKAPAIDFEVGDVTALPYDAAAFDIASIAFGIRNVSDPRKALAEMARVTRPGGRVVVVEFGQPRNPIVRSLYGVYRRHALPTLGGVVTGEREAYQYLEESAARFPSGEEFVAMMVESALFAEITVEPLTCGIAYLYVGTTASPF